MKKSKFLKKSLAMLLALMLVVAMIPLGASAAQTQPALNYLYVNDLTVANENGTFEVDAHYESTGVKLSIAPNALNYGGKEGKLYVLETKTSDKREVTANTADKPFDFLTYATSAPNSTGHTTWTLTMQLVDENGKQVGENLKVVVNGVAVSTTASLDVNSATEGTGSYDVDINNGSHEIILTVPKNSASDTHPAHFRVATQDNAVLSVGGKNTTFAPVTGTATTNQYDHYYDVAVSATDGAYILVTSESGKNQARWDITVKEVGVLTSFALGDYKSTINENAAGGPTVEVVLPKSLGTNEYGKPVDITLPVIFEQYGNEGTIKINNKPYESGDPFNVGELINAPNYTETFTITMDAAGYDDLQTYKLTVRLAESENTAIKRAFFNGIEATIDGDQITAVMPTNTDLKNVKIDLYTDENENVTVVNDFWYYANIDASAPDKKIDGLKYWFSDTSEPHDGTQDSLDISKGKQVVVEAENGDTQTYVLSATVETNSTEAKMNKIYIKGNGQEIEGTISGNTITFTVPYMTLNVKDWTIYATTNSAATAMYNGAIAPANKNDTNRNDIAVRNGVTTLGDLYNESDTTVNSFNDNIPGDPNGSMSISVANAISAVNMNDQAYRQNYTVVVKLEKPVTQKDVTVSRFEMSIQNDPTAERLFCSEVYDRVNEDNSVVATSSNGITQKDTAKGMQGTIEVTVPHSLSTKSIYAINPDELYRILTDIETTNNGVAYLARLNNATPPSVYKDAVRLSDLADVNVEFNQDSIPYTDSTTYETTGNAYYVIVLPEDVARNVEIAKNGNISFTDAHKGTVYILKEDAQGASDERQMYDIAVDGVGLKVTDTHDASTSAEISGNLPWSYTISQDDLDKINADPDANESKNAYDYGYFLTFKTNSPYATLTTDGVLKANRNNYLYSDGDKNGDGIADDASISNQKLLFVRSAGNSVNVYVYNGSQWVPAKYRIPNVSAAVSNKNTLCVVAENGTSKLAYTFKLQYNAANTEAVMSSFSIGNSRGTFNGNNISVVVPYGTDLNGLVPTFTVSDYAKVTLDSKAGEEVKSGKTSLNFNQVVRLQVTSEDGDKTNPYTVTVTVAEAFSDVNSGDWYYNNIMQAAANGIVSGYPDGTFKPGNSVTRRDFAIMLTQMLGVSNDGTAVSPFIDVDEDDYGVVAIAYCKAQGIISGYEEDGTFRPDNTITRQEAASMIVKAMGVSKASDELYPDDSTIAGWAKDAVYKAKAAGLMKGYEEDGTFRPTGKITRAEAASIMVNALNQ